MERGVIQASHSQMCKFDDDNSPGFELVYEAIQRYASEAPAAVVKRWTVEKDIREREIMGNIPGIYIPPNYLQKRKSDSLAYEIERFLHPETPRNPSPSNQSPSKLQAAVPANPHYLALPPAEPQANFGNVDYEVEEVPEEVLNY